MCCWGDTDSRPEATPDHRVQHPASWACRSVCRRSRLAREQVLPSILSRQISNHRLGSSIGMERFVESGGQYRSLGRPSVALKRLFRHLYLSACQMRNRISSSSPSRLMPLVSHGLVDMTPVPWICMPDCCGGCLNLRYLSDRAMTFDWASPYGQLR